MELITVKIEKPETLNLILGQTHFIKSVEDIHEALFRDQRRPGYSGRGGRRQTQRRRRGRRYRLAQGIPAPDWLQAVTAAASPPVINRAPRSDATPAVN